ncbi:vinorine synthase-like protein, partial [Tanacetum coccineum]
MSMAVAPKWSPHESKWKKMAPVLQDHQFGNLFQMAFAVTENAVDMDIDSLVVKLRNSFEMMDGEYLKRLMGEKMGFEIVNRSDGIEAWDAELQAFVGSGL